MESYAAVILSGGTGARLGGADKATIDYGGRTLLDHTLAAVADAVEIVVAGAAVPTPASVRFVREDPPLGGPVAGLYAAAEALREPVDLVVVLAVDMPHVTPRTVARLVHAAGAGDGAVLVGADDRIHLAAAVRTARLRAVRPADAGQGWAWRRWVGLLELAPVPARDDEAHDVDTWGDIPR